MYLCSPKRKETYFTSTCVVHMLEWVRQGHRHVARTTFPAELLSAGDAADEGILLALQLGEILSGPLDAAAARELTLTGGLVVPLVLIIEAMSGFSAVTATFTKTPAEKPFLCHIQFLRGLLDRLVLHVLAWFDTRDMCSDGLNKGVVERTAIQAVMDGAIDVRQETEVWTSRKGGRWCSPDAVPNTDPE